MTYWLSMYNDRDLRGFVETFVNNGYHVELSKPGRRLKAEVWKDGEKQEFVKPITEEMEYPQVDGVTPTVVNCEG